MQGWHPALPPSDIAAQQTCKRGPTDTSSDHVNVAQCIKGTHAVHAAPTSCSCQPLLRAVPAPHPAGPGLQGHAQCQQPAAAGAWMQQQQQEQRVRTWSILACSPRAANEAPRNIMGTDSVELPMCTVSHLQQQQYVQDYAHTQALAVCPPLLCANLQAPGAASARAKIAYINTTAPKCCPSQLNSPAP
jgi:hypothetical protein